MDQPLAIKTLQNHLYSKRAKDFFDLSMEICLDPQRSDQLSWESMVEAIRSTNFNLSEEPTETAEDFFQALLTVSREEPVYYFHYFSLFNKLNPSEEQIQAIATEFVKNVIIEYLRGARNSQFTEQFPSLNLALLKEIEALSDDLIKEKEVYILSRAIFGIAFNEMEKPRLNIETFNETVGPAFSKLSRIKEGFTEDVAYLFFTLISHSILPFPEEYYTPELRQLQERLIQSGPDVKMWDKTHLNQTISLNTQQFLKETHQTLPPQKKRSIL